MAGKPLYKAEAVDLDEEYCRDPEGCPCSKVTYFIASQDGDSHFRIDKYSGEVTVDGESYSLYPVYEIKIGATDDGVDYDTMTLSIRTGSTWDDTSVNKYSMDVNAGYSDIESQNYLNMGPAEGELPHHRQRRAVILPSNVTFDLTKYGLNQNITEIRVGHRIQFQLDILFPSGSTDMQVELFTPDSEYIIMMLCNVEVIKGSNLAVSGSIKPILESLNNSTYNDRAIIALGTVTNNASDLNTNTPSTIRVLYEAVMVENANTANNKEYWVSAGAEFNQENDVWVGQASFIANTVNDTTVSYDNFTALPQATFSGPTSMSIGSSAIFYVNLALMYPVMDIKFDMFAPINFTDVMSICDAKVTSVSSAYECGLTNIQNFVPTYLPEGNTVGNKRLTMALGRPINKLAREYQVTKANADRGIITFAVQITLMDDTALVGNDYWVGATVEIGTAAIWAGQLKIRAAARADSQSIFPTFNMSMVNGTSISQTKPAIVQIDMLVPVNSSADYLLEVVAPFQDNKAIFQLCAVRAFYGEHMACGATTKLDPEYIVSSNETSYTDVLRLNLGRISNVGSYGWDRANSTIDPDAVRIHILIKATDHVLATLGSSHQVYFGMYVGTTKLIIGNTTLSIGTGPASENNTTAPARSLRYGGKGSDTIPVGKTGRLLLDIETARNTIYSPFNVEFIMPNNSGTALLKICKVQLESVGLNNPCVVKEGIETGTKLLSSFDDGIYDRAVLNIPSLCNYEVINKTTEDHFILAVNFIILNNPIFATDNKTWISAGIMYSPTQLWVGQISVNADVTSVSSSLSVAPSFKIVENNGNLTRIPLGYPARYYVRIKIAPNNTSPLSLNVSAQDNALSICDVRVSRMGEAYPCANPKLMIGSVTGLDPLIGVNKQGSIDLGFLDNVGVEAFKSSDVFDSNTVELEIVTKLTPDVALAPDSSTHLLTLVLSYNPGYATKLTATVTVTATTPTTLVDAYTLASAALTTNVSVLSITGQDDALANEKLDTIVKSESKRIVVDIDTPVNSTSQLSVTVSTPITPAAIMEVLYIGLLDAGVNLPCVQNAHTTSTYEPRQVGGAYSDIVTLVLGYVCNVGADITNLNGTANRLRVESIVRLLDTPAVAVGSSVTITAAVNSNNRSIMVYTIPLTVADVTTFSDVYMSNVSVSNGSYLNSSESPIIVSIADWKTLPIVFTVPPFTSSKVLFDAVMPVNTSAILTVEDVQFVSSGRNIKNLAKYQTSFVSTKYSKYNTSQVTKYEVDMGVVSNGGVTKKLATYIPEDDMFAVQVTVRMADHPLAVDGSTHKVSFGIKVANVILILDVPITVRRTSLEQLIFNMTSAVNETTSTSSRLEVETIYRLSNLSTAEGQNSTLNFFLPPYVAHVSTTVLNTDKTLVSSQTINNILILNFGPLFFSDNVNLLSVLQPNSSYLVPLGVTGQDSVLAYQPVADTNTATDVIGDLDYVNFTITTTPKSGIDCTTGPLGMQTSVIKDCQLSSSDDSLTAAIYGRYNPSSSTGWSPFVHKGLVSQERYFQVYFGDKTLVSKVLLKQFGPAKAKTLRLRYSNDGYAWTERNDNVMSPSLTLTISEEELTVPVPQESRFLRVMITDLDNNENQGSFQFEFYGCKVSNDGPAEPCSAIMAAPTKLTEFTRRSFLYTGTKLFVCDGIQGRQRIQQRCFFSSNDATWEELDSRVGSILGIESGEARLFAVSSNGLHYMSSVNGVDWYTSVPSDYATSKALATFKSAIKVPVNDAPELKLATPSAPFIDGVYGATNDGIKKDNAGWKLIFSWSASNCCQ
ncbi:unnamed protein product [Lymnaea stagnalis]|uniref:F5/8 type C domain-containing protein n=1 Tax=Lymnaea stagnalis TaxID=6523 RepID=A0AAV2HH30_LYMST